jgi:hypothetical protein
MSDRFVNDWYRDGYSHGVSSLSSRANGILQKKEFLSSVKKISDQKLEIPDILKPSPCFLKNGDWQWTICIKLDFLEEEVFYKKYGLCIHEIKVALLSFSCFERAGIEVDGIYVFAKRQIWKSIFDDYRGYYNGDNLAKTILNISTTIDVLDMLFASKGYKGLKAKIVLLCGKECYGFENQIFRESIDGNQKIFMDNDAYKLTNNFFDGFGSFYFDNDCSGYRGDVLIEKTIDVVRKYLNANNLDMKTQKPEREKQTNSGETLVLKDEKNLLINSICPRCNGDGGAGGGCRKCDGSGWVSETARSSGHCFIEKKDTSNDNSRVSNFDYGDVHQGAHYRDRDGRFGSIPDYDVDD